MKNDINSEPSVSLTAAIVEWLNEEIRSQRLKPGDKLPSEKQLCDQFSVSRSVVREALSHLKSEGIVNTQQGRGAFVNERGTRQTFRLDAPELTDAEGLGHIIELMVTIEAGAARYAAQRRTADDLKRIKRALIGMEYAIISDKLGDDEDYAFHQAIVDSTKNPHFQMLNEYLEQHVRRLIRKARSNTAANYADQRERVLEEHKAILKAIEARDPVGAALAAETHLRNAAKRLNRNIKD